MEMVIIVVFVIGYHLIALEHQVHISKPGDEILEGDAFAQYASASGENSFIGFVSSELILIIGSAAGVAAMGMEKIDFIWYLKKISLLALLGNIGGAAVYLLFNAPSL